jgi:hypothetical protein
MIIFGSRCKTEILPLNNIQASIKNVDTDRYIYLRSRIITCDEANGNGDYLPKDEVVKQRQFNDATKEAYKSFVGKIIDYNHDTNIVIGKIIAVEFIDSKEGKIIAVEFIDSKEGNSYVDIICSIDRKCPAGGSTADQNFYNRIISRIENNELNQMSMEAFAENAECPYCKSKFPFSEPCGDVRDYMNAKIKAADGSDFYVYRIDRDLTFVGAGMVENPADKNAIVTNVLASEDKKEKTAKEVMSNMTALEFIKVIDALDNSEKNKELISKLVEEIKEPIFEKELGQYITQRMTSMEIKNIKAALMKEGKLIEQSLNAHVIDLNGTKYWLVMKNGIPLFKQSIQGIWGELLDKPVEKLTDDEKLEGGISYKEYAISDIFKRRMLATIQTKGEEYLMSIWYGNEKFVASTKSISEVFGFKVVANKERIEASSEKDKFNSCISANLENDKIQAEDGQTREDAVVAYCFNDTMGIHASMTLEEIYEKNLEANVDILGGKENFKAWLKYKNTGKWPTTIAAQLRIKIFTNAVSKLDNNNKEHLIKASELLKYGFDNTDLQKYNVLIATKDIEKLIKYGMEIEDIKSLYSKRFGF